MTNNGHHLNMHQHQLHHPSVHHLSPHLQHQQSQHQAALQQAHAQQQHNQLIAQHQLNNQAHVTGPHPNFASAMMASNSGGGGANSAAILLPPSPYGSDKSGDLSPSNHSAAYLAEQHSLHNEQLLSTSQQHQRAQHNLQQQLHYHRTNLTSPQSSPSSVVNLHSPTTVNSAATLIQNHLNGMPVSPAVSPVHCDEDADNNSQQQQQQQQQQQHQTYNSQLHQQHLAHHPHLSFAGNAASLNERQSNSQAQNSLLSKLTCQPIAVLQSATSNSSASVITSNNQHQALRIAPTSSSNSSASCTNSSNLNSNLISNLASAIVSTPVVVNNTHQQLAIDCKAKLHSTSSNQVGSSTTNLHLMSPNGGSANSTADEGEEINTKELAQRISAELKRYSIPQAIFAQRVLCRSQGTLSDLLRNPKPWSKLKSGRETFRRMHKWLEENEFQRMSTLRLAGRLLFRFVLAF